MDIAGEIILIDSNEFEKEFLDEILERLKYNVLVTHLQSALAGFEYLKKTDKEIFLIISELDFHAMSGIQLKEAIDNEKETKWKSIPFVFVANNVNKKLIDEAYKHSIHGFFEKPSDISELTDMYSVIIKYWIKNRHPNKAEGFYDLTRKQGAKSAS